MRLNTPNVFSTTKKRGDGNSSLVLLVIFAALTVILTFVCSLISPFPSTVAVQAVALTRQPQSSDGHGQKFEEATNLSDADLGRLLKNIINLKHKESDVTEEAEKGKEGKVKKTRKVSETAEQGGDDAREQEGTSEAVDKPAKESTKKGGKGWLGWIFGGGDGKDNTEQSDEKETTPKQREEDASPKLGDAGGEEDASPKLGDAGRQRKGLTPNETTEEQHEKDVVENNIKQTNDKIELVKIRLNGEMKLGVDNIKKKVVDEINKLKQLFNNELDNITESLALTSDLVQAVSTGGQYQVLVSREESPSERKEEIPCETRQTRDTGNSDKRRIDSHKRQDGEDGLGQSEAVIARLMQPVTGE
eukprot:GHVN01005564.1.p1 GENE.GHVN01005564.1~~GHVN01005564.1.p1  ORF type:complete len:361 (-),score=101.55 GHVN01005564.1:644-1726(-)